MGFFKKLFSPFVWGNLLAMAIVVILIFIGLWKGMEIYTRHGEGVPVPNVIGMMESDARYTLGRIGLTAVITDSAYNKELPAGTILEQMPGEGSRVKDGREIYLTVNSEDSPTMPVPDIANNCSLREAEAKLKAMGFKLGPVELVPGEDKDWVLGIKSRGRNVYAGERVPIDVPLVLQVGGGSEPEDYEEQEQTWTNEADITAEPDNNGLEVFE